MHTNEPREDPLVEMGYEIRDVDFPKVRTAAMCFFGFSAFCAIVGWFIYGNRFKVFAITPPEAGGETMTRTLPKPPYPMLQDNMTSKTDISVLRKRETARMTSTGYNEDHATVHIPVDRAMDKIVERGLPKTTTSMPAVSRGNNIGPNGLATPTGPSGLTPNGSMTGTPPITGTGSDGTTTPPTVTLTSPAPTGTTTTSGGAPATPKPKPN